MTTKDNRIESLFTPSGCLTATALEQLARGEFSGEALFQTQSHTSSCELCADALEGVKAWIGSKSAEAAGESLSSTAFSSHVSALQERLNEKYLNQESTTPVIPTQRLPKRMGWIAIAASLLLFVGVYLLFQVKPDFKPNSLALEKNVSLDKETEQAIPGNSSQLKPTDLGARVSKNSKAEEPSKEKLTDVDVYSQDELKISNEDQPKKIKSTIKFTPPVIKADEDVKDADAKDIVMDESNTEVTELAEEIKSAGSTSDLESSKMNINANKTVRRESKEEIYERPFTVVEQMPGFPGGEEKMMKFLRDNLQYPALATENGIQGSVYVTFVVEGNGKIRDVRILRGVGGGLDEEALRVVRLMPPWVPGKQNGKVVPVQFNLPIKFTLTDK